MIQVTCLFQQSRPNIYSDAINSSKFLLVSLLVDCISAGKLTKNTIPHRWIMVLKWGTADVTPLTGAKSNKSTRPIQMLCLADMLAFICHFKATRQTWITVVLSSVLVCNLHGLGPVSLCMCVLLFSCYLPPFSSSFHTLSRSRHNWGPDEYERRSSCFPPHFSHFSPALCTPALSWWNTPPPVSVTHSQ